MWEYNYYESHKEHILKTGYFELFEYDNFGRIIMQTSGISTKRIMIYGLKITN